MPELYYLKLGSGRDLVVGPSCDASYNGWIKLESVHFGQTQLSAHGSGGAPSKTRMMDITMTKLADQASPIIFNAAKDGRHFNTALIDFVDPDTKKPRFRLELGDVKVSSFQLSQSPAFATRAGDEFTFQFGDLRMNDSPIPDAVVDKALKCSPVPPRPKCRHHSHHRSAP
jgi:type VI protein secretion system component Hcp